MWVEPVCVHQEVDPQHLGHPLIGDDQGDAFTLVLHARQIGQRDLRGKLRDDAVVGPVASHEGIEKGRECGGLVVDEHDDRSIEHGFLLCAVEITNRRD